MKLNTESALNRDLLNPLPIVCLNCSFPCRLLVLSRVLTYRVFLL